MCFAGELFRVLPGFSVWWFSRFLCGGVFKSPLAHCKAPSQGGKDSMMMTRRRVLRMDAIGAQLGVRPRVHDLRHTHASRLIDAGVPLPVVQRRLGHESITTTVNTYGHIAVDADARAAAALD